MFRVLQDDLPWWSAALSARFSISLSLYHSIHLSPREAAGSWRAGHRCRWCTPRSILAPHGPTPRSMSNTVTAWDAYGCSLGYMGCLVRGLTGPSRVLAGTSGVASETQGLRGRRRHGRGPWPRSPMLRRSTLRLCRPSTRRCSMCAVAPRWCRPTAARLRACRQAPRVGGQAIFCKWVRHLRLNRNS